MYYTDNDFRLYHHGILGQKWGVRRYQNRDGSLTAAGRKRKIESQGSRLRRSQAGARLTNKIDRLEAKNYSDKRQAKIDKLKELRDMKLSDLSENEIKYGRMYIEEQQRVSSIVAPAAVVGGATGGLLAAAGYATVRSLTKSGKEFNKEFNETAKAVRQENKDRIQNEKNKIKSEQERKQRQEEEEWNKLTKRMEEADNYGAKRYDELLNKGYDENRAFNMATKEVAKKYGDIYPDAEDVYIDDNLRPSRNKNSSVQADARTEKYYSDTKKYFSENKSELLSNAKKNDRYDLEFLEITQNDYDDMSDSERNSKRIRDYEKYLDDPEGFTRKHYGR